MGHVGPCWGHVELCWDHVGSCSVKIGARLGLCWGNGSLNILKLCWGYVGPSGVYVGAKFAHLELCWGYRCVIFHVVTFIPTPLWPASRMSELFVEDCWPSTSPQWPASFTFRAFSPPTVACESVGCERQPSKGRVAAMLGSCSRHFFQRVFSPSTMTVFEASLGPCWTDHEGHLNLRGHYTKKPPERAYVGPFWAMLGSPIWGLCWGHVRLFCGYVVRQNTQRKGPCFFTKK